LYFWLKEEKMRVVQLNIPDSVDLKDYDFSMIVASKLYEDAKLSAGQAAEIAGLTKRAFLEILGKYGVSIFSSSLDDLHLDIANA
jgi:predicted HTH domain antitoxin